jgi:hypothetical protein
MTATEPPEEGEREEMGIQNQILDIEARASNDTDLYGTAGIAALITVAVMVLEMFIILISAERE